MKPQRIFLYCLILSVMVSALLGIGALLGAGFGELQLRVVLTTVTIALGSVLGLACGTGLDRTGGHWVARCGIWLLLLAGVMIIGGMWTLVEASGYWRISGSVAAWAFCFAHLALISRSPLPGRFRWSLVTAYVLIPLLAAEVTLAFIVQPTMDVATRIMGVTGILVAANTILIEILHRLSGVEASTPVRPPLRLDRAAIDAEIEQLQARIAELEGFRRQA